MSEDNVINKLNEASKNIGPIDKDGNNKFQHYTFQSETAIKYAVESAIREVGLRIIPNYEVLNQYDRTSKGGGNNHFVDVMGTFTITDGKEKVIGTMPGSGQDSGEKAMAKACTSSQKYFYKQLFNITDKDEDPDSDDSASSKGPAVKPATKQQQKTLISLFKAMTKTTGVAEDTVQSGYLKKAHVTELNELNHESAKQLIALVTKQLEKQSAEKGEE